MQTSLNATFCLIALPENALLLPREVMDGLNLSAGELLGVRLTGESVTFEVHKDVFRSIGTTMGRGVGLYFAEEFWKLPVTAIEADGTVVVPSQVIRFDRGERLLLHAASYQTWLSFSRAPEKYSGFAQGEKLPAPR